MNKRIDITIEGAPNPLLDSMLQVDREKVTATATMGQSFSVQQKEDKKLTQPDPALLKARIKPIKVLLETPWIPGIKEDHLSTIQSLMFKMIRGNVPPLKELVKKEYFLAVIWKRNSLILSEARQLMNQIFSDILQQLNQNKLSLSETFYMEMIIGELLALYPYLSPQEGESLHVPMQINGIWELIDYTVKRLELTPKWLGSPLVAYGLMPKTLDSAPPLLLFKGTTYPADEGFMLSLMTDINPFAGVGNYGFRLGKKRIDEWLEKNTKQTKAQIYGKSLGGALAYQTALHFSNKVDKVMTFGAPGFSSSDLKRCQNLEKRGQLPLIHMFCQENDPVTKVDDVASSGIYYYQVIGKHKRKGVAAHADFYSIHENSKMAPINPSEETHRWTHRGLTILRSLASVTLFPLLITLIGAKVVFVQTGILLKKQCRVVHSFSNKIFQQSLEKARKMRNKKNLIKDLYPPRIQ